MAIIAASLPFARVHRDDLTKGGGALPIGDRARTRSRYDCQQKNRTVRKTPRTRHAMMSGSVWVRCMDIMSVKYAQGVFHSCGAVSPPLSTNTTSTRPLVMRNAPNQSTLLSSSADGTSFSIKKMPPSTGRTARPAMTKYIPLQVDDVYCVTAPPITEPMAAPTGAPAEKVANATERVVDGGKVFARMPIWVVKP